MYVIISSSILINPYEFGKPAVDATLISSSEKEILEVVVVDSTKFVKFSTLICLSIFCRSSNVDPSDSKEI